MVYKFSTSGFNISVY